MIDWLSWLLRAWIGLTMAVGAAGIVQHDDQHDDADKSARRTYQPYQQTHEPAYQPASPSLSALAAPAADADALTAAPQDTAQLVAAPVAIEAPTVGISTGLVAVGKTPDGALAVPDFGMAGWYRHSARPGDAGPAVLAGHVDSTRGPDVFFTLRDLTPGDEVTVRRGDGTAVAFVVEEVETTDKDELPVDRIFADTQESTLRLITCGGVFDATARSYDSNVIVYASAKNSARH